MSKSVLRPLLKFSIGLLSMLTVVATSAQTAPAPLNLERTAPVPPPALQSSTPNSPSIFNRVFNSPSSKAAPDPQEPLDPALAFQLSATRQGALIQIRFDIAKGYYLYTDKLKVQTKGGQFLPLQLPKGLMHFDTVFNKNLETYRDQVVFTVKLAPADAQAAVNLTVHSQGCADIGICYPPQQQNVSWAASNAASPSASNNLPTAQPNTLPAVTANTQKSNKSLPETNAVTQTANQTPTLPNVAVTQNNTANSLPTIETSASNETGRITQVLAEQHWVTVVLSFIGFGLLLAFTPCVLPMVPIVSAIVIGNGTQAVSRWRGLALSAAYVLGMACVYTLVGVAAGLLGQGLAAALQNVWVLSAFAGLMVVLAGAQFGWYTLALPHTWTNALHRLGAQRNGALLSAGIMGAISALMVGPCVTAPLAATLSFIAQTGQAVTGGIALFSLAIGMGIPLLLIGAGGGAVLPKAGTWMNTVKHGFGILLLGVALWMVQAFMPAAVSTSLWLALCVIAAVTLGALSPAHSMAARSFKALGLLLLVWAGAIVWGMAGGRYDVLQPLAFHKSAPKSQQEALFTRVASADVATYLQRAQGQIVVLDFYADWCVSCIEMERYTFSDPKVRQALDNTVRLQVDLTHNTAQDQALLKQYGLFGPPAILFFNAAGQELRMQRVIGFQPPERFAQHINALKQKG